MRPNVGLGLPSNIAIKKVTKWLRAVTPYCLAMELMDFESVPLLNFTTQQILYLLKPSLVQQLHRRYPELFTAALVSKDVDSSSSLLRVAK